MDEPILSLQPKQASAADLAQWLGSAPGSLAAAWESQQLAQQVVDVFGYHALQLGLPVLSALDENRMPSRWVALGPEETLQTEPTPTLRCDFTALPFDESSIDLAVLPHTLEWCGEATACLREVERVLRPEGRLVLTGFNPNSLWAMRQRAGHAVRLAQRLVQRRDAPSAALFMPEGGEFIPLRRLRDWLRVLNFEVETVRFGLHGLPLNGAQALDSTAAISTIGAKLWPNWGAVYVLSAIKRVPGPLLMRNPLKKPRFAAVPVSVASKQGANSVQRDIQK